jgi:hypothetical protein
MEELSQSRILETVPVGSSDHELVVELKVVADKGQQSVGPFTCIFVVGDSCKRFALCMLAMSILA